MKRAPGLIFIVFILLILSINVSAQSKLRTTGFVEYLNNTWIPSTTYSAFGFTDWQNQSSVYNRFNLWWSPVNNLEFHAGIRNNFTFGPLVVQYNKFFDYADLATYDDGYLDLTWLISTNNSYIFFTNLDRLNMKWTKEKFELTIGRQRINWGTNLVWNPNDIFNAFNYFDFNYIERPGSDAALLEYYTSDFSSIQLAGKLSYRQEVMDSLTLEKKLSLTAAALYKFNKWSYDFQFFGGIMQTDFTAGLGWAGNIGGAGFSGEATWFKDIDNFSDTTGIIIASISANYIFKNQLLVNLSIIYNSNGSTGDAYKNNNGVMGSFSTMFSSSLNVKNLTPSRFDIFGQLSYPATPLINVSLSGMFNPYDHSSYIGPSATFSLTDNMSLMLVGQLFIGDTLTEFGDFGQMYFLDLKWNF
ncbi:MAG: hypothetical protein H8E34_01760 [Bacteroidetes bacterium]|nr:hypothetical protein [Bacteroidota bacterium]MBL6944148.1 hypothetical protein [Bacteroidales bacterium]